MQDMPSSYRGERPSPTKRNISYALKRMRQAIDEEDYQLQSQRSRLSDGGTARNKSTDARLSIDAPLTLR